MVPQCETSPSSLAEKRKELERGRQAGARWLSVFKVAPSAMFRADLSLAVKVNFLYKRDAVDFMKG